MNDPLRDAYATAHYRIDCGTRTIERCVGRLDVEADVALAAAGCAAHWHILTPCNPGSQPLSDDDNCARVAALRADLAPRGWILLPSVNTDAEGGWPEPGFCILDAPQDHICHLARDYGQLAIVAGALGTVPQLVWIDDAP